jgi:hypothetical protein
VSSKLKSTHPPSSIRGHLVVPAAGLLSALVPVFVAFNHALAIQVVGAAAGALVFTGGVGLARLGWRSRQASELHRLAVASGFLACCIGAFLMSAGVGLYH